MLKSHLNYQRTLNVEGTKNLGNKQIKWWKEVKECKRQKGGGGWCCKYDGCCTNIDLKSQVTWASLSQESFFVCGKSPKLQCLIKDVVNDMQPIKFFDILMFLKGVLKKIRVHNKVCKQTWWGPNNTFVKLNRYVYYMKLGLEVFKYKWNDWEGLMMWMSLTMVGYRHVVKWLTTVDNSLWWARTNNGPPKVVSPWQIRMWLMGWHYHYNDCNITESQNVWVKGTNWTMSLPTAQKFLKDDFSYIKLDWVRCKSRYIKCHGPLFCICLLWLLKVGEGRNVLKKHYALKCIMYN